MPWVTAYASLIAFSVQEIRFRRDGGGIWVAVGVLHFLLGSFFVCRELAVLLVSVFPAARMGGIVILMIWVPSIALFLIYPAVLICHAIGLFKGAKKLAAMDDVGAIFD